MNSWSLYQCRDQTTFDETSQQCLMKIPISDTFDRLASSVPIQKIENFVVPNAIPDEEQDKSIIETVLMKKLLNEVRF